MALIALRRRQHQRGRDTVELARFPGGMGIKLRAKGLSLECAEGSLKRGFQMAGESRWVIDWSTRGQTPEKGS